MEELESLVKKYAIPMKPDHVLKWLRSCYQEKETPVSLEEKELN